jgi:peptidyl-prolyl cis-trans isomerase SurA
MIRRSLGLTVGLALLGIIAATPPAAAKVVERIIARVNGEIITQRMFERELQKVRMQLAQDAPGADSDARFREASKDTLRDLIDQALLVQKAKDLDINVETDIVKRLDEVRKQFKLATLEDLQAEVEKQGMLFEDFKDQIRRSNLTREVIGREVGRTIRITRADALAYFNGHKDEFRSPGGVRLAEVLISTEKRKPEEAAARAKEALAELKAGIRFVDVVKKYSDAPSAKDDGDLGFFKTGTKLDPSLAVAIDKLDVGETTEPIETKYGYEIIKLMERISPGIPTFDEVEQHVENFLYNEKMTPALRVYLARLRKDSYITLAPGYVDSGAERPSDAVLAKKGK